VRFWRLKCNWVVIEVVNLNKKSYKRGQLGRKVRFNLTASQVRVYGSRKVESLNGNVEA